MSAPSDTTSATQTFTPMTTGLSIKQQRLYLINSALPTRLSLPKVHLQMTSKAKDSQKDDKFLNLALNLHKNEEPPVPLMRGGSEVADLVQLWNKEKLCRIRNHRPKLRGPKTAGCTSLPGFPSFYRIMYAHYVTTAVKETLGTWEDGLAPHTLSILHS